VRGAILGRNCHVGRSAVVRPDAVLGDKTVLTDFKLRVTAPARRSPEHGHP